MTAVPSAVDGTGHRRDASPRRLRRRHPVATFLALVAVVAAVLGSVGWSGALAPRLTTEVAGVEQPGRVLVALAEVTNDGPLTVDVEAASWDSSGLSDVTVGLAPPGATLPATATLSSPGPRTEALPDDLTTSVTEVEPFTLVPGESRVVVARGVPSCSVPSFDALHLEVRTELGAHRTVTAGGGPLSRGGTCP